MQDLKIEDYHPDIPHFYLGHLQSHDASRPISCEQKYLIDYTGFVRVLENLESPGILLWHFPGLESPGKGLLVLEICQTQVKNMKYMADSKEN